VANSQFYALYNSFKCRHSRTENLEAVAEQKHQDCHVLPGISNIFFLYMVNYQLKERNRKGGTKPKIGFCGRYTSVCHLKMR